jgi:acetyl-CoA carboxylase biotin carboxyl carrier protein
MDGRRYRPSIELVMKAEGTTFALHIPRPGVVRGVPMAGTTLTAGAIAGELDVLSTLHALTVPRGAAGAITFVAGDGRRAKIAVEAGQKLLVLDPSALSATVGAAAGAAMASASTGLVFRAPLGGRYYARPSPGEPAFVTEGQTIAVGQTVALLEVMKTFNRVRYAAENGLPERAKVVRIVQRDGDDVTGGDPLLELEAL